MSVICKMSEEHFLNTYRRKVQLILMVLVYDFV